MPETTHPTSSGTVTPPGIWSRLGERYDQVARMNPRLKGPGAYFNWMRANYETAVGASRIKARPLKITFDPTNVCQLRCPLCPTGLQMQDREKGHAQRHLFEHLLEDVGDDLFFIDFFNWGEPLLNPHVEDLVKLATDRNITCSMSSNLSLPLTDARIHRIVTSGLNEIIVSLDGASSETYGQYRREGKFALVCDNMRRIIDAKRQLGQTHPLVTWQFLVFRFNEGEMEKARAMADEIGVDRLTFRPPFLDEGRYPLSDADKREIAGWKPQDPLYQIENAGQDNSKHHSRCGWHYMSSAINWDGTVAPCCTTFSKQDDFGTLGKSGEHSYMDVLNNPAFRSVRERFSGDRKDPVALVCEHCPTPAIMDYHQFLNRQIVLFTVVTLLQFFRRPWERLWRRHPEPAPRAVAAGGTRPTATTV